MRRNGQRAGALRSCGRDAEGAWSALNDRPVRNRGRLEVQYSVDVNRGQRLRRDIYLRGVCRDFRCPPPDMQR
jgi:hypothetical protein